MIAIGGALLGACAPATVPYNAYGGGYAYDRHLIDVDGHVYWQDGVAHGDPPPGTIIPDEDPPVGQMMPTASLSSVTPTPESIAPSADHVVAR